MDAAAKVSAAFDIPIEATVVGLGQTANDVLGKWTRSREIEDSGCLLVRPDRFVAWRCERSVDDPTTTLTAVLAQILDRPTP